MARSGSDSAARVVFDRDTVARQRVLGVTTPQLHGLLDIIVGRDPVVKRHRLLRRTFGRLGGRLVRADAPGARRRRAPRGMRGPWCRRRTGPGFPRKRSTSRARPIKRAHTSRSTALAASTCRRRAAGYSKSLPTAGSDTPKRTKRACRAKVFQADLCQAAGPCSTPGSHDSYPQAYKAYILRATKVPQASVGAFYAPRTHMNTTTQA